MAYTNFVGYMDPTPKEFKTKDWVYKYSLQMFQNGLTGNCYGIASSVAAIDVYKRQVEGVVGLCKDYHCSLCYSVSVGTLCIY